MSEQTDTAFNALVGRRIVEVTTSTITLDDETRLEFAENQDCCAYAYFDVTDYDMTDPPIITAIEDSGQVEDGDEYGGLSVQRRITLLGINGKVGDIEADASHNGYYFATLTLNVMVPGAKVAITEEVVSA